MKTRFVTVTCLAVLSGQLYAAPGVRPAVAAHLPNYDKRAAAAAGTAALAPNPAQAQETTLLKARVPDLQISYDKMLGTVRLVSSARGFLTGPDGLGKGVNRPSLEAVPASDPHRVIKAFLNEHAALFGHDAGVLANARVQRDYVTEHNGLHTTIWAQTVDDIPVFEALLTGHVTRNGELASVSSYFVPGAAAVADAGVPNRRAAEARPRVSVRQALVAAAANVGAALEESAVTVVEGPQGAEQRQTLQAGNLLGPAWGELVWLPMSPTTMRLCWRVILTPRPQMERYAILVDVETGEVLVRHGLTEHIQPATYNVYTNDSPSPYSPGSSTPSSYQPPYVNRALVTLSALDTNASPIGWVPDGINPPTTGNNVDAFLWRSGTNVDQYGNPIPDVPRPQATGTNRVFNFPLSLTNDPSSYESASTVQLFYRANWYHDRLYQLGFTEAAGNFQSDNFGRGGFGGDPVICLVQYGADLGIVDNSMFSTSPDGYPGYCMMFIFTGPTPARDGSLDQEVVCHEMTHGLSDRLVGGGVGIYQLQTEGMGEGWSDFYSLCLLSQASDNVNACYPSGGYASYLLERSYLGFDFTQNYYYGIRRYPYSTDMTKNPLTFKDIDPLAASSHFGIPISPLFGGGNPAEVHNQGEVWCVTLREVWARLVTKSGWAVGNQLVLQLVTDGMKLAPPNPTFLEARDAIIEADLVDTGGDNFVEIWSAFAKRGMGFSAIAPPSDTTIGVTEAFDLPPNATPDGILEVNVTPASGSVLFFGDSVPIYVRVTDAVAVTNATIAATVSGGATSPVFLNNGASPDARANDSIYTALFNVPSNQASVTITLVISATNKVTSTNSVTYITVAPPPNDYFTNATKVPVGGATYLTSNKRATLEPGEPVHAGVYTVAASLWWNYTPTATTNVLVDTVGSDYRTVVAVYTNSTLATLAPVASAVGSASLKWTSVNFTAEAGLTYHIAVASYDTNRGTLHLNIAPGQQPDTNAPVVTITSPPDGILVTTNRVLLTGSAVDPGPNPSGIRNVTITVSPSPGMDAGTTTIVTPERTLIGALSTNWSSLVGLVSGVNSIQVSAIDYAGNRSTPVTIQATYRVLDPLNDFFVNATVLTDAAGTNSVNTVNATKEVGEPDHAGVAGGKSVWWSYTPSADGVLTLSTTNSTFDTVMAMYTGATVSSLTPVAANDDAYPAAPGGYSQIIQAVRGGQTYHIAVDGYDGASGVVFLTYSFAPATVYHLTVNSTAGGVVGLLVGNTTVPASVDVAANATVVLTATPDAYYQFDMWDGAVVSLDNPLTLQVAADESLTAHFIPVVFTDGFESGDLTHLAWATSGAKPWVVQTNVVAVGRYAARSGAIGNNQSSSLILAANFRDGDGAFDYRVSSEPNFDVLGFYVDGLLMQQWSGDIGWANYAFPITAGTHTLEWRYTKDAFGSAGLDAAFIDDVNLPLSVALDSSSPAHLQLQPESDGWFYLGLQGQTNQQYVVQVSSNLISWQSISTNVATTGYLRIALPEGGTNRAQFYRAVARP